MKWSTQRMTFMAMMLSLAMVLEIVSTQVPFFQMPQGGSITLAAIPIILTGWFDDWKSSVFVAFLFSFLQGAISPFYIVYPLQFLLDYPLAFTVMGLSTIIVPTALKQDMSPKGILLLEIGIVSVMFIRFSLHVLSGMLFFGNNQFGLDSLLVSAAYNAPYMIATTIVALTIIPVFIKLVEKH